MRICKVKGCNNKHLAKGYCVKHYKQFKIHEKIFKRTCFTPNEIVCKGKICEIILYNNNCKEIARTIINKDDFKKVKDLKWCLDDKGYVLNGRFKIRLHHLILPRKKGLFTDHQDGNPLNNRKNNLRYATNQQNQMNKKNVKGYYWHKKEKKWVTKIVVNNKYIHLGCFVKESEARQARKNAELEYFGEFAK